MKTKTYFPITVEGEIYYVSYNAIKEFVESGIASPMELNIYNEAKQVFEPVQQFVDVTA